MLLQSSTLGELCAGIGTVSLAATILKDNVLSELGAGMKLSTVFVLDRLLAMSKIKHDMFRYCVNRQSALQTDCLRLG